MNTMHHIRTNTRQQGVTLIELMIALLLSLLLVAGMIQVFAGNRTTYEFNQGLSRIQENARFSLDHIAFTARMAGYSGCLSDVAFYNNLDAPVDWYDIENGVVGHDSNGTGRDQFFAADSSHPAPVANPDAWKPGLPVDLAGRVVDGSDVLIVRGIAPAARVLATPFSDADNLYVAAHDFLDGEILIVSDCQKASLFQLTDSAAAGANLDLQHSDAGAFAPGNNIGTWGPEQEYGLGAEVARLQSYAFYVGVGASGEPALFQLRLQHHPLLGSTFDPPEELVEGIDTMQVRYGVDLDNDGSVNDWQTADIVEAAGDWPQVLSIEVSLLARTPNEYGSEQDTAEYNVGRVQFDPSPDNDRRLRQVFSSTIGVRNRLP